MISFRFNDSRGERPITRFASKRIPSNDLEPKRRIVENSAASFTH
jgi:hypothetical protein